MLTYRDHESRLGICNQYKHISIQAMFVNPQIKIWTDINTRTIIIIKKILVQKLVKIPNWRRAEHFNMDTIWPIESKVC